MIARQVFVFLVALALASTIYSASVSPLQPALQKRGLAGMQRLTPKAIDGLAADHPLPRHEDEGVDQNATFSSDSLRGRDRPFKAHSSRHSSGMAKIKRVTRPESNEDYDKRNSQRNGNGQYGSHHQGNGQQNHNGKGSGGKGSSSNKGNNGTKESTGNKGTSGNKASSGNKGSSGGSDSSGDGGKNGDENQEGDQDQSGGSGATGPQGQWSGDATFFEQKGTGAGACSGIVSQDTDKIAALSAKVSRPRIPHQTDACAEPNRLFSSSSRITEKTRPARSTSRPPTMARVSSRV